MHQDTEPTVLPVPFLLARYLFKENGKLSENSCSQWLVTAEKSWIWLSRLRVESKRVLHGFALKLSVATAMNADIFRNAKSDKCLGKARHRYRKDKKLAIFVFACVKMPREKHLKTHSCSSKLNHKFLQ